MKSRRFHSPHAGFTLIELLVSMTVLIVLVAMVNRLVAGTSAITTSSRKHLGADNQARLIFDRLANDFGRMVKRPDIDYLFYKQDSSTAGVNDKLFFYTESPAYYSAAAGAASTPAPQSSVALVGYRLHNELDPTDPTNTRVTPQLERLGQGLSWDQATSNDATTTAADTTPGGMIFLCTLPGTATPLPATTLAGTSTTAGNWSKTVGTVGNTYDDGASVNYHVVGDQVFRMELAFLLKDGSVATRPLLSQTPTNWPTGITYEHDDTVDPASTNDGTSYAIGSRWYNTSTNRGFVCTSAAKGAAVWSPIGIQDTSAIIVALAILDSTSRAILGDVSLLTKALPDPTTAQLAGSTNTPPKLMASVWSDAVNNPSFATTAGLNKLAAGQVRIYQRYFYLNNP